MKMSFDGTAGSEMWVFLPDEGVTTDELIEILGENTLSVKEAEKVIMAARAHWFEEE